MTQVEWLPLAIVGLIAAVAILAFFWNRARERERTEALERLAMQLGARFEAADAGEVPDDGRIPLLSLGRDRRAFNILTGQMSGGVWRSLDYQYVTGSGKSTARHLQTVAMFELKGRAFPDFEMEPEHLGHKLLGLAGWQDIDFDGWPDFSKTYHLQGKDEAAVRAVFHPGVLQFFSARPGWRVEGAGNRLVFFKTRRRVPVEEMVSFLEEAKVLLSSFL